MSHGGAGEGPPAARDQDEANIRWLLAAVLHQADPPASDEEE